METKKHLESYIIDDNLEDDIQAYLSGDLMLIDTKQADNLFNRIIAKLLSYNDVTDKHVALMHALYDQKVKYCKKIINSTKEL